MADLVISLPNDVSEEARQAAQAMNISLDELFAEALNLYLATLRNQNIREQLDLVYETETSEIDSPLLKMQLASVCDETW
jgi:DNA-binding protein Fis